MLNLTCPICRKVNEIATIIEQPGRDLTPQQGDINMCIGCGDWSVVEGDRLRRPTNDELAFIRADETCQMLVKGWLQLKMQEAHRVYRR